MPCADEIQYDARRARVGGREVCAVVCFSTGTGTDSESEWRLEWRRDRAARKHETESRCSCVSRDRGCENVARRKSCGKRPLSVSSSLSSRAHTFIHIQYKKRIRQDSLVAAGPRRAAMPVPCHVPSFIRHPLLRWSGPSRARVPQTRSGRALCGARPFHAHLRSAATTMPPTAAPMASAAQVGTPPPGARASAGERGCAALAPW